MALDEEEEKETGEKGFPLTPRHQNTVSLCLFIGKHCHQNIEEGVCSDANPEDSITDLSEASRQQFYADVCNFFPTAMFDWE